MERENQRYTVGVLAELAGVSVRTLRLYDEKGLVAPSARSAAGYRLYGRQDLLRLQQVLFYRELDFPLQEMKYPGASSGVSSLDRKFIVPAWSIPRFEDC